MHESYVSVNAFQIRKEKKMGEEVKSSRQESRAGKAVCVDG